MMISLFIWIVGAALFFGWHIVRYTAFLRHVMAGSRPLLGPSPQSRGGVRITVSRAVTSPLAFGIFAKAIVVPADFEQRFTAVEQRLALAHEIAHHARRDMWVNLAALALLSLHWFNPLAHIAHRAFRLDQEAACDAIVLRGASADERHAYGSALFKSAVGGVPLAVCAMGTASQVKVRLGRIINDKIKRGGSFLAAILIGCGLIATASGGAVARAVPDAVAPPAPVQPPALAVSPLPPVPPVATDVSVINVQAANPRPKANSARQKAASPKTAQAKPVRIITVPRGDLQTAPVPPAVPQPPAPPGGQAVPVPLPPAVGNISATCPAGSRRDVTTTTQGAQTNKPRKVTVIICRQTISYQAPGIIDMLTTARNHIVQNTALSQSEQRAALAALDAQIAVFTRVTMTF